jgi:hypothetical protein
VSEHLRRAILCRLAIAAIAPAIPLAWALGRLRAIGRRVRYGRGPRVPGLDPDGEPLDPAEAAAFLDITRGQRSRT